MNTTNFRTYAVSDFATPLPAAGNIKFKAIVDKNKESFLGVELNMTRKLLHELKKYSVIFLENRTSRQMFTVILTISRKKRYQLCIVTITA